jgi:histone acetyltransferase SAS3
MTENDNYGCHFVGYFSKEKRPSSLNNVSCILVLPIHMRKGYGQYLIEFSYLLTRHERKTGSPEKPLSDMGLVSYRKYWRLVLCEELLQQKGPISISAISDRTGMTPDDIVSALEGLRALVRDPVTKKYAFRLDIAYFKQYIEKCNAADNPKINPECLVWTPYIMGRFGQYEDGPALQTVQQRDEMEVDDKPAPEEGVQMAAAAKANGSAKDHEGVTGDEADPSTPALPAEESINGGSPAPGTPLANGSTIALAGSQIATSEPAIPPTRYEIFPPIPGQPATKRRPGRPFGTRRRTSTPNRARNTTLSIHTAPVSKIQLSPSRIAKGSPTANGALTPGTISLRRTRSRLGESVTNGDDVEEGGAVKAVVINGRRSTRSSASSLGSPHTGKDLKGKGRATPVEEEHEEPDDPDIDADGDYDEDAEGDMDIDAEGDDDDDILMVGG